MEATGTIITSAQHEAALLVLHGSLQEAWVQYLECLDAYQNARAQLSKDFSTGFFSLAQANFKSTDRRRYGRDYYDERTKASRRFTIVDGANGSSSMSEDKTASSRPIVKSSNVATIETNDGTEKSSAEHSIESNRDPRQQTVAADDDADPDQTDQGSRATGEAEKAGTKSGKEPGKKFSSHDPLMWYGILVPQQLRAAQASFASALDGPLLRSIENAARMRKLEAEIRAKRKMIRKTQKLLQM